MDDMLDVKMPPPPPVVPEPEPQAEVEPASETEEEEQHEVLQDEEVFKDAPQIKKVKRKPSEKQLAHLKRMREKKDANAQQKREFLAEQKAKQKKFVQAERKRAPPKPKKVQYQEEVEQVEQQEYYEPPQQRGEPINHRGYDTNDPQYENPEYQGQEYYYEEEPAFSLTPAQIKQLQRDAIMEYEGVRKQRKAKEQQQQVANHIKSQRQKVFAQMSGQAQADPNDPWANCFN